MFEIHLTVETDDISKFRYDCSMVGVKPLLIELQNLSERKTLQKDVMTAKSFKGGDWKKELRDMAESFKTLGYEVLREKVEVNPYTFSIDRVSGSTYYESHVRIVANNDNILTLATLCRVHGFHISKNAFKVIDPDNYYMMATLRMYDTTLDMFIKRLDKFKFWLKSDGYKYDKVEIECAVYDSNVKHDKIWI
jgi:hypothetical protein